MVNNMVVEKGNKLKSRCDANSNEVQCFKVELLLLDCFELLISVSSFLLYQQIVLTRRVTRGGEGEDLLYPFSEIGKRCSNFGGKCPDWGHLWVKFLI